MRDLVQRDPWEMAERAAIKIARAAIRLKYSVAAEAEINEGLPAVQAAVRKAVAEGRPWQLDVQAIFLGEGDAVIDPDAIEASSE